MGKLIFNYTDKDFIDNSREASKIEFDVPDDMDIHEYKVICVRMAHQPWVMVINQSKNLLVIWFMETKIKVN